MHHAKEMMYIRRFNLYLPVKLFERIKLFSKFYNISITKLMVELLEIGYIDKIDTRKKINKFIKMKGLGEEYRDNNF